MAEQTAPEPTMEEILASIRRIISDDDSPLQDAPSPGHEDAEWSQPLAAAPVDEPAPVSAAPAGSDAEKETDDDDVLDLTEPAHTEPAHTEPAEVAASFTAAEVTASAPPEEPLVSEPAAAAAASSFGRLSAAAARPPAMAMPAAGRTLEDVVRDMLRPMLKSWLDENLGAIVQQRVDEEVQRIARGRVR